MIGTKLSNIYWIDSDRFDTKLGKSKWLETSEVLVGEKFSVTLVCGFGKEKYIPKGYRLKIKYFRAIDVPFLFRCSLLINIFFWLIRKVRQGDIVIVSPGALWVGFFLKLIKKCNVHLDVRTVPVEIHNLRDRIDRLLFWRLPLKLFKRVPDSFSFITELLKRGVEREFSIRFRDYVIWHSGVNTQHFKALGKNVRDQSDRFMITYLGVVTMNRGIDLVLEALSCLKAIYKENIVFQVIGDGSDLSRLKRISSDLGLDEMVDFKGYIQYEIVPKHLRDADCFISPLPDRPEWNVSSPIKVFEYLACGKPVILSTIPAHKNIVKDKNFVVWTQGDRVEDFVRAIEYAYENRDMLAEAAKRAPDFVKTNYEWRVQGKKLANYLKRKYCASK
jgi:glycosyltransferase involved in cell wall biosynthesis